jgi:hypothetical protein
MKTTKTKRPGSLERGVLLRALRARKGYARRKQRHKLCNQNGWCFWAGQLLLIEKLEAPLAQENDQSSATRRT